MEQTGNINQDMRHYTRYGTYTDTRNLYITEDIIHDTRHYTRGETLYKAKDDFQEKIQLHDQK